jgi:hypothetical protein
MFAFLFAAIMVSTVYGQDAEAETVTKTAAEAEPGSSKYIYGRWCNAVTSRRCWFHTDSARFSPIG